MPQCNNQNCNSNSVPCYVNNKCLCAKLRMINQAYVPSVTICYQHNYFRILPSELPSTTTTTTTTSTTTTTTQGPSGILTVTTDSLEMFYNDNGHVTGTVVDTGAGTIIERGFVWATSENPTIDDNILPVGSGLGFFEYYPVELPDGIVCYFRAYAINDVEVAYGVNLSGVPQYIPCLAEGTLVTMANGTKKAIENITYDDKLVVWDFDSGNISSASPVWISIPSISKEYNLLKFSNGSELKTMQPHLGHRIFNVDKGMFTYPMTEDTPIGSKTFTDVNEIVTLVSKEIINKECKFYNIITYSHINLFANGVLTSAKINNIYPIVNMKFIKDDRIPRSREEFENVPDAIFYGFRLSEQPESFTDLMENVNDKMKKMIPN